MRRDRDNSTRLILEARGVPELRVDEDGNEYLLFPDGRKQFSSIYKTMESYRNEGIRIRRVSAAFDDD